MVLNVSKVEWKLTEALYALLGKLDGLGGLLSQKMQGTLDRDKWESLRKGVNYEELPLEVPEVDDASTNLAWPLLLELLRYAGIVLLVIGLVVLILKLLGVVQFKGKGRPAKPEESGTEAPTALSTLEVLQQALKQARERGDYREALRLQYQISLRHLDLSGKLRLTPEKTNWEYVQELRDRQLSADFAVLTHFFEYVWFGAGPATEEAFANSAPYFERFNQKSSDGKQA